MIRSTLLASCLVFLWFGTASAADQPFLELEFLYWSPNVEASARSNATGLRGNDIDLESTVDLGDSDAPIGRLTWHTGRYSRIFLEYTQMSLEGDATLQRDIRFGGLTFAAGSGLKGDLDFQFGRVGWVWQFLHLANDRFRLGTLLDVRVARAELTLKGRINDRAASVSEDITAPLPGLGLALDTEPLDWLQVYLQGSGIPETQLGYFYNAEGGIKIIPFKNLDFSAGYRYQNLRVEDDDDFVKLKFSGPFAGIALRF